MSPRGRPYHRGWHTGQGELGQLLILSVIELFRRPKPPQRATATVQSVRVAAWWDRQKPLLEALVVDCQALGSNFAARDVAAVVRLGTHAREYASTLPSGDPAIDALCAKCAELLANMSDEMFVQMTEAGAVRADDAVFLLRQRENMSAAGTLMETMASRLNALAG